MDKLESVIEQLTICNWQFYLILFINIITICIEVWLFAIAREEKKLIIKAVIPRNTENHLSLDLYFIKNLKNYKLVWFFISLYRSLLLSFINKHTNVNIFYTCNGFICNFIFFKNFWNSKISFKKMSKFQDLMNFLSDQKNIYQMKNPINWMENVDISLNK